MSEHTSHSPTERPGDLVLYATDGMSDWEYSYLVAATGLARHGDRPAPRLRVAGDGAEVVTTAGGLRLLTDVAVGDLDPGSIAALVLPGADTWGEGHDEVLRLATELVEREITVAAICGATLGVERAGLLEGRRYTTNAEGFLDSPGYVDAPVVEDGPLITAGATEPVAFAAAVLTRLQALSPEAIEAWRNLHTTGDPAYFEELMRHVG